MGRDQTNAHTRKGAILSLGLAALLIAVLSVQVAFADLQPMSDTELAQITGTGFSSFMLTQENGFDIARMQLDVRGETWTEVDRLQMGNWNGGWDQNWSTLSMGNAQSLLNFEGLHLEAVFSEIGNGADRQLQQITFGYSQVTGTITVDFASFTGYLQGVTYTRANLGSTTIVLDHEPLEMTVDVNEGLILRIGN